MRRVTHELHLLNNMHDIHLIRGKFLHFWFIYPFRNHHLDALTELFDLPVPAIVVVQPLFELLLGLTMQISEEAKDSLDLRSAHGPGCSGYVAAAC